MDQIVFTRMCRLMATALALILLGSHLPGRLSWAAPLLGCLPLVGFHLSVLLPRAKDGLTQTDIDSVYYFGFLVTVFALGISAVTVGMNGAAASVDSVVIHFGTGLVATAYAVVARMHLQSKAAHTNQMSMEAVMDRYVEKSVEMVKRVDEASLQLTAFSKEIVSRTIEAAEQTRLAANEKMLDTASQFSSQMSETLEQAREGVHDFRLIVNSTAFAAERHKYADSMREMVGAAQALNGVMAELVKKTQEKVGVTQQDINASLALGAGLSQFAQQVKEYGGPKGSMEQSAKSLQEASASVVDAHKLIAGTVDALQQLLDSVEQSGTALKSVRTISKRATDQLEALSVSSERISQVAAHIGELSDSTKSLVRRVKSLDTVVEHLSGTAGSLAGNLEKAETATSGFDVELARLPRHVEVVEAFGSRVEQSLAAIAVQAEQTLSTSERLSEHSESAHKTLDGATKLVSSAALLETSVASLQKLFGDLGSSVVGAQTTILEASNDVKSRLADSSRVLDEDMRRSATSASSLADHLSVATKAIKDLRLTNEFVEVKP